MREKEKCIVITFHTTAEAMAMEKFCNSNCIPGRLIPVPREISAGCGLAWKIRSEESSQLLDKLRDTDIEYEQIAALLL